MENENVYQQINKQKLPLKKNSRKTFLNGKPLISLPVHGILELVGELSTPSSLLFLQNIGGIGLLLPVAILMAPIWNDYQLVWSHLRICQFQSE